MEGGKVQSNITYTWVCQLQQDPQSGWLGCVSTSCQNAPVECGETAGAAKMRSNARTGGRGGVRECRGRVFSW